MRGEKDLDIYQMLERNRLRLAAAVSIFTLLAMAVTGIGLYILYELFGLQLNLWLLLALFWAFLLLYSVLRYAFGGKWVFKALRASPGEVTDHGLESALGAALLASGVTDRVRLFPVPSADINAFTLSLPDGSYALFATSGLAEKLPARQREAVFAHEIAHMQAGDCMLHTIMIHLAGFNARKRLSKKLGMGEDSAVKTLFLFLLVGGLSYLLLGAFAFITNGTRPGFAASSIDFWAAVAILFLGFAVALPAVMHRLLRLLLDRKREYSADLQAVYMTRDPEAVYGAVRSACEDVRDVLLLPTCLDALLFHPVVDYTSYRPFQTQPTMMERMARLEKAFPLLDV